MENACLLAGGILLWLMLFGAILVAVGAAYVTYGGSSSNSPWDAKTNTYTDPWGYECKIEDTDKDNYCPDDPYFGGP
jgi:hypothetical protein